MKTIHEEKYYTSLEHYLKVYESSKRKSGFEAVTEEEYRVWKINARHVLSELLGLNRMMPCEPVCRHLESTQLVGYKRDKLILQTEPDVWMPFYVLIPDPLPIVGKRPCMIAAHGHCGGGKYSVAGRTDIPAIAETVRIFNYDYGVRFVKEGYIVFCPDARGFGERREWMGQGDEEEKFLNSTCIPLNNLAISMGLSLTGMWIWDLMRLLDYIPTREDCDGERIGCCGLSGGGLQTLWLSAMDDRVACSIVSGYFYGYKDSLLKVPHNCGCNFIPHLWEYADMGDLGALIAPRPLLIETGSRDSLNGERGLLNVTEQVETTRKAFALFDAKEKLYHHIFDGEHRWDGESIFPFVKKWLGPKP